MQKSERIERYTADELRAMRERGERQLADWEYVDSLTDEELEASIDLDEEGEFDLEGAVDGALDSTQQITVRFDGDIIDWFKAQGPGYQARMNSVLRRYVESRKRSA